jgi:tRNA dimethylallyltransferase
MFHPDRVDPALAAEVCIHGESLPDEVRRLVAEGRLRPGSQAAEALGYKQVLAALYPEQFPAAADRQIRTLDDAFERTKILTRRFAKQQRTWLKRFADVHWIDLPRPPEAGPPLAAALAALASANHPA